LISVSGTKITINGASGHVIDGNGAKWWDGKGGNGGKKKPKVSPETVKLIDFG
jgi:galacturan 1,4-alpha-galacturonidase